jgi:DNA-binding MarR family transcriptional regulator
MGAPGHEPDAEEAPNLLDDSVYRRQADFRYAIRRFSRFSEDQARLAGITPQQHLLLLTIRGHPSYPIVTIGDVADRLQIRHHSASLLVERSRKAELLERREDPADRRRALVALTENGLRVLEAITRANRREMLALDDALFGVRESLLQLYGGNGRTQSAGMMGDDHHGDKPGIAGTAGVASRGDEQSGEPGEPTPGGPGGGMPRQGTRRKQVAAAPLVGGSRDQG